MWTRAYRYHEDRTPTHGYEPTRDAVMAAFAKSKAYMTQREGHTAGGGNSAPFALS